MTHTNLSEIQPFLYIDCQTDNDLHFVVTRKGDISVLFKIENPEIFTPSDDDYLLMQSIFKSITKILPPGSIIHRQDFFFKRMFQGTNLKRDSFLNNAQERFFFEKPFLSNESYIYFTLKGTENRKAEFSILAKKGVPVSPSVDQERLKNFIGAVKRAFSILNESKYFSLNNIKEKEINKLWFKYFTLSEDVTSYGDITFGNAKINANGKTAKIFNVSRADDLPEYSLSSKQDALLSTDITNFQRSFLAPLTFSLDCDHIVNTYIFTEDLEDVAAFLEKEIKSKQWTTRFSSKNVEIIANNQGFLDDIRRGGHLPCRFSFNVTAIGTEKSIERIDNAVINGFQKMGIIPYISDIASPFAFMAGAPGNAAEMPTENTLPTFVDLATCFINTESHYRTNDNGIVLYDRLTQRPVIVDVWDEPYRKKVIANRNFIAIGPSGEGKSVLFNHIFSQYLEMGFQLVLMDIGNSYKKLCELYGGKYIVYDEKEPLPFNPFLIDGMPGTEDMDFLISLIYTIWRKEKTNELTAIIEQSLTGYFTLVNKDKSIKKGFPSYYNFVKETFQHEIKEEYRKFFNIDSFFLVLEKFATGIYKDLFNADTTIDLKNDRFVVFELDNIKDNDVLFPIVALIITHTVDQTIFKVPGRPKCIALDEAWKVISKDGMDEFVMYLYKTIRKHNGQVGMIVQDITDLPDNKIGTAMRNNSAIKIILSHEKNMNAIPQIQDKLSFTDNSLNILASCRSRLDKGYTEFCLQLGNITKVYRLQLSPEAFWTFTSDKQDNEKLYADFVKHGNIELAIMHQIEKN
jgi:conjugation system TraG family ATPase